MRGLIFSVSLAFVGAAVLSAIPLPVGMYILSCFCWGVVSGLIGSKYFN